MKKYLFILFALVLAASCNDKEFLEEHSYSNDSQGFYQSERAMEIGLASCYSEVQYLIFGNMRQTHSWMLMGVGLDSFAQTSANDHFSNWSTLTGDSGYARHWSDYLYKLAIRANTVVDMIDAHDEITYSTATYKNELRAEAVFMRAFAYRCLAGMYGGVAYDTHMTTEARYDYSLLSRQEVWEKLAEDFKYAEENLPVKPRLMGTLTKAAAGHYLAETYLALGKFSEAEAAATRVIGKSDGDYEIMKTRFGNRADQATDRSHIRVPTGIFSAAPPSRTGPQPRTPTLTIRPTRKPSGFSRLTTSPVLTAIRWVVPEIPGTVCMFLSLRLPGLPGSRWVARTVPVPTRMARSSTSSRPMLPAILPV